MKQCLIIILFSFDSTKPPIPPVVTGAIRNDHKVSLVWVSSCGDTASIRDDPYWTSRKNNLELIELSSFNKISNTGSIRDDPYSVDLQGEQFRTDRAIQIYQN